ncbi:hypothetical protein EMPS_01528 [Entomortierella parvispora]|uniref:Cytochrome b561 domain-containing protein n=1 Tax=Entomortierella parvispora TaxID=205924 RepID=A0A9P3H3R3_9FUNG|nr:hypothetical protein EMPS_01528 [Entomortierella parvispora]
MVLFSQKKPFYRTGYLVTVVLSVLSASTTLLLPISAQATSSQLCSGQVCISATIYSQEPNTIEFSLSSKLPVGWLGLGMGGLPSGMTGNDLAICWPTATGKGAIISQRAAAHNGQPSVKTTSVAFQVQTNKSMLSSTKLFTCTYSRPLNLTTSPIASTAKAINVIFAVGLHAVQGTDPQTAVLQKHTFTGTGSLTIVRTEGSSSGAGGVNGTSAIMSGNTASGTSDPSVYSQASLDEILANEALYSQLVKAHGKFSDGGLLMSIAFLILFPTGAFIVRFFSHRPEVFRFHRPIQVLGFLTVISAFTCIIVAVSKNPDSESEKDSPTASTHASVGLFLVCALLLQILIGVFIFHAFNPSRDIRTTMAKAHLVSTWGHRAWGYLILLTGFTQVNLGLSRYGQWPLGTETIWRAYDTWVVMVIAVFFLGSAFKMWRTRQQTRAGGKGEWDSRESALKVNNDPYHHHQQQQQQPRPGRRAALEDDQYELQAHSRQSTGGSGREEYIR